MVKPIVIEFLGVFAFKKTNKESALYLVLEVFKQLFGNGMGSNTTTLNEYLLNSETLYSSKLGEKPTNGWIRIVPFSTWEPKYALFDSELQEANKTNTKTIGYNKFLMIMIGTNIQKIKLQSLNNL